jgi:NAD(P)-dependent dehydrogenase (short-subunit alcohol dehydrogenase family)
MNETKHLDTVVAKHTADQSGRVAAITGTTSGTGFVCARELARLGAHVLLLNRPSERATSSLQDLKEAVPDGQFTAIDCDLQDFDSVRAAAKRIRDEVGQLDILCNNAGVMALPDRATGDGYDVQMQTNVLSHVLLTRELFDLLKQSDDARIVNHTSMARLGDPLEPKYFEKRGGDLGGDGTDAENAAFSGPRWQRYHQTKLANCAFTYGLIERMCEAGIANVKAVIAHPGLAATNLQTTTAQTGGMQLGTGFMQMAQSPEDGALGILRGCADPAVESGDFFGPKEWAGFPERLPPEDLLRSEATLSVFWAGCDGALGPFPV